MTDLHDELAELLEQEGTPTPAREAFAIDTMDKLAWYGRKRAGILAEIGTTKGNAEAIVKELEKVLARFDERFEAQAKTFVQAALDAEGLGKRTLRTLGGNFAFRKVPGGIRVEQPAQLLAWAKDQPADVMATLVNREVVVKETVPSDALKAYFAQTGEIPPGARYQEDAETFSHQRKD